MLEKAEGFALLRKGFEAHQINHKPKGGVQLDFVGHAATTDRLLDVDPEWSWEPVAFGPDGLPLRDENGGLWIKLTVLGVTRFGYGDADGKTGGNGIKEAIGDGIRNAAMRFGVALDLWHKGDLHLDAAAAERAKAEAEWLEAHGEAVTAVQQAAARQGVDVAEVTRLLNEDFKTPGKVSECKSVDTLWQLAARISVDAVG